MIRGKQGVEIKYLQKYLELSIFVFYLCANKMLKFMSHYNLVRKRLKTLRFGQPFYFNLEGTEMGVRLHYNRHLRCYKVVSTATDDLLFYHGDMFVYCYK